MHAEIFIYIYIANTICHDIRKQRERGINTMGGHMIGKMPIGHAACPRE